MWDKMMQNDVTRRDVLYVAGAGGLPMPQVGVWGVLPHELFCKCKVWEGHDRAILKAPGKKRLKEFFHRNLEKKVFASKKRFKRFLRGACIQDVNTYLSSGKCNTTNAKSGLLMANSGIILGMGSADERRRYIVTAPLIGWAQTQNDPWN